jgi:hypothetical protein
LSVPFRFTDSDYCLFIFNLFLQVHFGSEGQMMSLKTTGVG